MSKLGAVLLAGMLLTAALLAGGCRSQDPFARWTQTDDASARELSAATQPLQAGPQTPAGSRREVVLPEDAGPADYVRLALERNPAIRAARQRLSAELQRIPQVTSLDDPMLMVSPLGEMAETAAGEVGLMTSLSQRLPFPGKLDARGRVALQQAQMARAELARTRLNVIAESRRSYWSHYDAVRAIDVVRQGRDLLQQLREAAESAYRVGRGSQQDVLRASVQLSQLEEQLITLRQRQASASARLNALVDRPVETPLPSPEAVSLHPVALALQPLIDLARQSNPRMERLRRQIASERARLDLAKLARWPDLTVGLNYNVVHDEGLAPMATGDDQWWLSFAVNLPIWQDKLDAGQREARSRIFASLAELHDLGNTLEAQLQDLLVQTQTNHRQAELFEDVLIPQARQTLDASLAAYRAGNGEFLEVVTDWQRLLEFQQLYHRNLAQFEQNLASLRELVGQDIGTADPADDAD